MGSDSHRDVIIIGAGAAGLSVGAVLAKQHPAISFVILDASPRVGNSWQCRYNRLHLHTPKITSALPYKPYSKDTPTYPSRDQVRDYLQSYAEEFKLDVRTHHQVTAVKYDNATAKYQVTAKVWQGQDGNDDDVKDVATSAAGGKTLQLECRCVVLATGAQVVPFEPQLPGRDKFRGTVLHSSAYKDGQPFKGQRVLVVGFGNSGGEISLCLSENGAKPMVLIRRDKVNIISPDDGAVTGLLVNVDHKKYVRPLAKVLDKIMTPVLIAKVPNVRPYGVPQVIPAYFGNRGVLEDTSQNRGPPHINIGQCEAIKRGDIKVLQGELRGFSESGVLIAPRVPGSKGCGPDAFGPEQEHEFDAVVLCTGYDHTGPIRGFLSPELLATVMTSGAAAAGGAMKLQEERPAVSGAETAQPGLFILGYADLLGRLCMISQESKHVARGIAARLAA